MSDLKQKAADGNARGIYFGVISWELGNVRSNWFYHFMADSTADAMEQMRAAVKRETPRRSVVMNCAAYRVDDEIVQAAFTEIQARRQLAEQPQSVVVIEDDTDEDDTDVWQEEFGGEGG